MRINEIVKEYEVEEGWKDWVAGAALGAAALSPQAADAKSTPKQKPTVTQQVKAPELKKITPEQSRAGHSPEELKSYVEVMAKKYLPANQVAQFIGQVAHETANFTSMIEQNPGKNLKHYAKATNPLGNKGMNDAQKYIGRGFLQITGKYNYKHFGDKIRPGLGDELLANPDLAMRKDVAIALAVMFWRERVAPKIDAGAGHKEIATAINGRKPKGLDSRAQAIKVAALNLRRPKNS
jgi:predicted chitinase